MISEEQSYPPLEIPCTNCNGTGDIKQPCAGEAGKKGHTWLAPCPYCANGYIRTHFGQAVIDFLLRRRFKVKNKVLGEFDYEGLGYMDKEFNKRDRA